MKISTDQISIANSSRFPFFYSYINVDSLTGNLFCFYCPLMHSRMDGLLRTYACLTSSIHLSMTSWTYYSFLYARHCEKKTLDAISARIRTSLRSSESVNNRISIESKSKYIFQIDEIFYELGLL